MARPAAFTWDDERFYERVHSTRSSRHGSCCADRPWRRPRPPRSGRCSRRSRTPRPSTWCAPTSCDLQAALARQSAASNGVGLTYWFQWFGGGTAPGNYSVVTPWLSAAVGAALLGAIGTVAVSALAPVALAGTRFASTGAWMATIAAGLNLWSGRIPFALGPARPGVLVLIAVRRHQWPGALLAAVGTAFCSPVCGALLAFGLIGTVVFDRSHRRLAAGHRCYVRRDTACSSARISARRGPQPFSLRDCITAAATAGRDGCSPRPPRAVRLVLLATVVVSVALALVPNGMGSNFVRFPYVCLPRGRGGDGREPAGRSP